MRRLADRIEGDMKFKEHVENNVTMWLLGSLTTGFIAGISAYEAVLRISGMETIAIAEKNRLVAAAESVQNGAGSQPGSSPLKSELDDTHWFIDVDSDNPNADMDMLLLPAGRAYFLLPNSHADAWRQEGDEIVVNIAGSYAEYRATLKGKSRMISGVGKNLQSESWQWTATKYP